MRHLLSGLGSCRVDSWQGRVGHSLNVVGWVSHLPHPRPGLGCWYHQLVLLHSDVVKLGGTLTYLLRPP